MILIFYSFFLLSFSQFSEYSFYDRQSGLSSNVITDTYIDSFGFLWISTNDGLNRFDGKSFKVYRSDHSDSLSLPSNHISSISQDVNGDLWISTWDNGIAKYDRKTDQFKRAFFNDQENVIKTLHNLNDSLLAISTWGEGLIIYNKKRKKYKKHKITEEKSLSNQIRKILKYKKNQYFVLTTKGLFKYLVRENEIRQFEGKLNRFLKNKDIRDIKVDGNKLFIATYLCGIYIIDLTDSSIRVLDRSNSKILANNVNYLEFMSKNELLIATWKGLQILNLKTFKISQSVDHFPNLSSKNIKKIQIIYKNVYAVATTKGLHFIKNDDASVVSISGVEYKGEKMATGAVLQSFLDQNKKLWIATQKGVFRCDANNLKYSNTLKADFRLVTGVFHFAEDQSNNIWMASQNGLFSFHNKTVQQFERDATDSTTLFTRYLSSLYPDQKILWIGSGKGLEKHKIGSKYFRHFKPITKKKNCEIIQIIKRNDQELLLATEFGLQVFNIETESFKFFDPSKNELLKRVASMYLDSARKQLFLATANGLLKYQFDNDSLIIYNESSGLSNTNVIHIISDSSEKLWLSTINGLNSFNLRNNHITSYKEHLLLKNKDFYEFSGAYIKSNLLIGHKSGMLIINPNKLKAQLPRKLYLDFITVNGKKEKGLKRNYTLESDENNLSFHYSAIDYVNNNGISFSSRLNGYSDEWVVHNKGRAVNYLNLKPGEYQFELIAHDEYKNLINSSILLPITIKTPFYQSAIFQVLIFIVLIFLLISIHKFRVKYLIKEERTRQRIARNLHDELGATISSIRFLTSVIGEEKSKKLKELGKKIEDQARMAYESVKDVIWTIEPENDSVNDLINHCIEYSKDLIELTNINIQFSRPKYAVKGKISSEKRHHLWLMYKELISNLLKHSSCETVKIRFIVNKKQFRISVIDDGLGFRLDAKHPMSYGLKNLKVRSEIIDSELEIQSELDKGTKVRISCLV